ncbi:hypothetical protein LguiA_033179 [Lonicera macranthoides]
MKAETTSKFGSGLFILVQVVCFGWTLFIVGMINGLDMMRSSASEPRDYACNGLHKHSKVVSTGTLSVGLLTTVLSVVYSTVRDGSSSTLLSPPSSPRADDRLFTRPA